MKNTLLAFCAIALLTSCEKSVIENEEGYVTRSNLTHTVAIDSMKQTIGGVTTMYHFDKNPNIAKKWRFQFWWGVNGHDWELWQLPPEFNIGNGIRYTPIFDPNKNPGGNGERVPVKFTWYLSDPKNIIMDYGHFVPDGDSMDGLGPVLPG